MERLLLCWRKQANKCEKSAIQLPLVAGFSRNRRLIIDGNPGSS
jgi:hypothetical protein